jgi:hypothetical protein
MKNYTTKGRNGMKNVKMLLGILIVCLVQLSMVRTASATAVDLGLNITVSDNEAHNWGGASGYAGFSYIASKEDQEVEPGAAGEQSYDMEGTFIKGNKLTVVGGYNFKAGEMDFGWNQKLTMGDIFVDVNGDAKYGHVNTGISGTGYKEMSNSLGYEYVFKLDTENEKYQLIFLTPDSKLVSTYFGSEFFSEYNLFKYASGGTLIGAARRRVRLFGRNTLSDVA